MAAVSHLVLDLVRVCGGPVGVLVGVQRRHKLVVVDVTIAVTVENVGHSGHLQLTGGELCAGNTCLVRKAKLSGEEEEGGVQFTQGSVL